MIRWYYNYNAVQWSARTPGLSSRVTATFWWRTSMTSQPAGLSVKPTGRGQTWPASTARERISSWQTWSSTGQSGMERRWGWGAWQWGQAEGKYLPFLGYLDCGGDKGGERELQLAGWNHLGLRELGRRLLLIINVNTISLLLSGLFVLGEPDRKIPSYKGNHECVFIGKNLDDPGKWWDGVCEWSRWSFDCLCKI